MRSWSWCVEFIALCSRDGHSDKDGGFARGRVCLKIAQNACSGGVCEVVTTSQWALSRTLYANGDLAPTTCTAVLLDDVVGTLSRDSRKSPGLQMLPSERIS